MKRGIYITSFVVVFNLIMIQGSGQGIYQIWGMTSQGGTDDIGAIFKTDGQGRNIHPVYSFPQSNAGATPMYNQLTDYNGKFYAMTSQGGIYNSGVIFEWDPVTNIYIKKYDFELANGINPHGSLVVLNDKLYGMTLFGGANDRGVIFEWDPATNIYLKKYDFDGTGGSNPYGSLLYHLGRFYGLTHSGGIINKGVLFEWNPTTNNYTKKYDFDGIGGEHAYGNLTIKDGKMYGMTSKGGINNYGVIFDWNPNSDTYTKHYDFTMESSGNSYGSLILLNEKFYGLTLGRPPGNGASRDGNIFEWNPTDNTLAIRYRFDGYGHPRGNLLHYNGKLYGAFSSEYISNGKYFAGQFEYDLSADVFTSIYPYTVRANTNNTFNGERPYGTMVEKNGKLYGMTSAGGSTDNGVIFEVDPATNSYTKRINFNDVSFGASTNSFTLHQNHLYGITSKGGFDGLGSIFEWDFHTNKIAKKHDFEGNVAMDLYSPTPRYPSGKLTFTNGKFYGLSYYIILAGGPHPQSHIFEWDHATNNFTQKLFYASYGNTGSLLLANNVLFGSIRNSYNNGLFKYDPIPNQFTSGLITPITNNDGDGLVEKNGKIYGTANGGINNAGLIFEYDPVSTTYLERYNLEVANGSTPIGSMVLYKDKLYGMTAAGGNNNLGVIYEWDPESNIYTKKYDLNLNDGGNPISSLILNNKKFYGMTRNGGSANLGTIFEWDPATNVYIKTSDFTGANGRNPTAKNELTLVPIEVSVGMPGTCQNYNSAVINEKDNDEWIPITDEHGYAIAEIRANGNNLGNITASLFINNNPIREDGTHRLYLDRNITITPQFQPVTPVNIRIYIRETELNTIKNAFNSLGTHSGINSVNDLAIFKNDDHCEGNIAKKASHVVTTATAWGTDYVLSATVSNFSTFYFASKASAVLPLTLLEFSGRLQNNDALLNWKTENELNTLEFIVERSLDGSSYKAIGKVAAASRPGIHDYRFTDPAINNKGAKTVWYRLKQYDIDGQFVYSKTVTLSPANENTIGRIYPNPVNNILNLSIYTAEQDHIKWQITDATGKIIYQQSKQITAGNNNMSIDVTSIATGVYYLSIKGNTINKWIQFVKQ